MSPRSSAAAGPSTAELPAGFSRRGLLAGGIVAAFSFLFAVLWAAFGDSWRGAPQTAEPSTFSVSALGHRAAAELLSASGLGVATRQSFRPMGLDARHPLLLAEPRRTEASSPEAVRLATAWEEAGGRGAPRVVVLPKWRGEPEAGKPSWLGKVALVPTEDAAATLALLPDLKVTAGLDRGSAGPRSCHAAWAAGERFTVDLEPAQLLVPQAGLEVVIECPQGWLVARLPGGPATYVVADPDLFNNHGLGRADHAALFLGFVTHGLGAQGVVFDETIHGFTQQSGLLAEALRFPLVLAVTAALFLAGLATWAGVVRLGKPLPEAPALAAGKSVLIDTTAALLTDGGHAAESVAQYARQVLRDTAAASFLPADLSEEERLSRLTALARSRGVTLDPSELVRRVGAVKRAPRPGAALSLARQFHRFRLEMTHGPRKSS